MHTAKYTEVEQN